MDISGFKGAKLHPIDISSIKPGDKVTVGATVEAIGVETARISIKSRNERADVVFYVGAADLVSHTPAPPPIKVGDRVMRDVPGIRAEAEVIGIHRTQAWLLVRSNDQAFVTEIADVTKLRHAPPPR